MRRFIRTIGWSLFCLSFATASPAAPAAAAKDKQDKQGELNELRGKIERLQRGLESVEANRSEAADALKASETAISDANRQLHQLGGDQRALSRELAELNQRVAATQNSIDAQRSLLDRLVLQQYREGGGDGLRLFLEGRDLNEVERQVHYLGYISRARLDLIRQLGDSLAALSALRGQVEGKRQQLAENEAVQLASRKELEKEKAARKRVLAALAGDITKNRKEIGRLRRDEDRLAKLVEQLGKLMTPKPNPRTGRTINEAADKSMAGIAFSALRGKLKLPARGELINRYGGPREEAGITWKGLFIRATPGQPVNAVADGLVIYSKWVRGFGNLLVVDHGSDYMSVYGNTESILKEVGQNVRGGEQIALTGDSGGGGDSGVYFELRHQGNPFDPMRWIKK